MYDYGYGYGYTAESVADATMGSTGLLGLFFGMMIFSIIISLIVIISNAKILKKAGKPWWACLIPIYSNIVMIQIAKLPMIYLLFYFLPIVQIYAMFKVNIEIAKKFGKSTGFGVGMTLLGVIFIPLLAFSDNKYEDSDNSSTINNNQQFDATNIINNQSSNDANLNDQNFNTITPFVSQDNNVIQTVDNQPQINEVPITPVQDSTNLKSEEVVQSETVSFDVEAPVSPAISEQVAPQMEQPTAFNTEVPVNPVMPEQGQPVSSVGPTAFNMEMPVNSVIPEQVQPVSPVEPTAFNMETPVSPVQSEQIEQLSPQMEQPTAFNMQSPVSPVQSEQIEQVTPQMEQPTAFNMEAPISSVQSEQIEQVTPQMEQPVAFNMEAPVSPVQSEQIEKNKKCKNCGTELPDIVSICPNCGTDNE